MVAFVLFFEREEASDGNSHLVSIFRLMETC
jgi:hypothetical protein